MTVPVRGAAHALLAGALLLGACQADEKTPQGVAERFVDQHYVQINLQAAEPFCMGLALEKLRHERQLTQGQRIDASTRKPKVHYRIIQRKEQADHASYVFEGTIRVPDAGKFTRKWLITTRRAGGVWKVSNYEEFD
ncbi:MAG: hypothetical protein ACE5I7_01655 [Candidatus Binatia bacterium]